MFAWQATVQDDAGNAVPLPVVTVYQSDGITLADIYSENGSPLPNPFTGTIEGFVQFWANPGKYRVIGSNGGLTSEWFVDGGGLDSAAIPIASYSDAQAVRVNPDVNLIRVMSNGMLLEYARDPSGTALQTADGAWWSPVGEVTPEHFGGTDLAALQAAADYAVAKGAPSFRLSPGATYDLAGGTLYINSTGDAAGEGVDGVSIIGGSKEASRIINGTVSIGYRSVENANQSGTGGEKQASNSLYMSNLEIEGALELYGCQRASTLINIRVVPTKTRGFYARFCNTLVGIAVRVDNGGNDNDGLVFDTCPNLLWLSGSANYNRTGLQFVKEFSGSQNCVGVRMFGLHLEGNRRIYADLQNVTTGHIELQAVSSTHWDPATYPLVRLGGAVASNTMNVHLDVGYINGRDNTVGVGIEVGACRSCSINRVRMANLATGINVASSAVDLTVADPHFDSSVAVQIGGDTSRIAARSGTILPLAGGTLGTRSSRWEGMAANLMHLGIYTVATLPAAAGNTGALIYVSDATGGAVPAFSNGSSWLRVDTRAVIS